MDANAPLLDDTADAQGPVDSDEEKDLVMAAIARSRPRPLDQHISIPLRRRYAYLRVKDMLSTALGGGRGGIFGGAAGATALGSASLGADADGAASASATGIAITSPAQLPSAASLDAARRASIAQHMSAAAGAGSPPGIVPVRKASGVLAT